MPDTEQELEFSLIRRVLTDRSVPVIASTVPLVENPDVKQIYEDLVAIRDVLKQFSSGNFDLPISGRGVFAGYLKTLQANLRHLSWQVEQVAAGDFSQRVDFMGDFSKAFNMLTEQLETSIDKLKKQEAERRAEMLLNSISTAVILFDEHYQLADVNLTTVKMFGFETKEQFFNSIKNIGDLSPKHQPNGKLSDEEAFKRLKNAGEKEHSAFFWQHQHSNGELIPAEITLNRIIWDGKEYLIASVHDLRELMKTRKMLERLSHSFRNILDSSPVCLTILRSGIVHYVTPFMTELLGVTLGDKLTDYFCDAFLSEHLLAEVEKHSVKWRQVSIKTKQGEQKEMLANLFLTDYFDETGIAVWLIDVTKIRQYELELIQARNTAEDLARLKGEFLRNVSHEIKTPMNAVVGMLHLLKDTELAEQQAAFVNNIENSSKQLLRIIGDVLDFSEMEDNELTLDRREFSLDELLKDIEQDVRRQCAEQQLTFSIQRESFLPPILIGDAARFRQILEHLLDNAVKFTHRGSVCLKIKSSILETAQLELFITISDTGIGLSEKDLLNIFTPFSQADGSRTRSFGGTGLGLSICQMLVKRMGGTIWAESQEGKGANFAFTACFDIPAALPPQELPKATVAPAAKSKEDKEGEDINTNKISIPEYLQGASILLADDNRINQIVAAELLKKKGFQIDIASNGKQAVEKVKQNKYALVLMDIQMPVMDGTEATMLIRQLPAGKNLPVVALTANDSEADCKEYYAAGMDGVLGKPVNPALLYNTILRLLQ